MKALRFLALLALAAVVSTLLHELGHCVFYWIQGVPAGMSLTKEFPLRDITAAQYAVGSIGGPLASLGLLVLATALFRKYSASEKLRDVFSALILANVYYVVLRSFIALLKGEGGELDSIAGLVGLDFRAVVVVLLIVTVICIYVWIRAGGPRPSVRNSASFFLLLIFYVFLVVCLESVDSALFWRGFPTIEIDDGRTYNAPPQTTTGT
ncbi:MAG: hypothetical protein JSW46_17625 [Gemmatimonadota bacterium]|nr:MAG: hypothetical protein JSW46_17625 [Gemmatimonadota bacterium]